MASPVALVQRAANAQSAVIDIGGRRELFLDNFLIDRMAGTELRLERPIERERVLELNRPWEGLFSSYSTVIRDNSDFLLYYRGIPTAGSDGRSEEVTCFARSADGIHWSRPTLGIHEVRGTRDNNVILANDPPFSHNFCPFLDTKPGADPNQRFKAIAGTMKSGLAGFVSADGVHWNKLRSEPLLPATTASVYDSQNLAFWSQSEGMYVCYYRTYKTFPGTKGFRWVSRATSPDFLNWSRGVEMTFGGAPPEHIYTNQTSPYYRAPHIYVSIAARFMLGRQVVTDEEASKIGVHPSYYKDCADGVLLTSRGGNSYDRTFLEGFPRPGVGLGNWVSRDNYPALNVVETSPEEMSFYVNRHYGQPSAHLSRYTLRIDGFGGLTAPYKAGEMVTRPLRFAGSRLDLNYSTSAAGFIRVGIERPDGSPLPGFEISNCLEIIGDRISREVAWKGGPRLSELAGQPVRLRFRMKDSQIFSIQFSV